MGIRISTRHLQMMLMVTRTGNVSDAATVLGVTQSALSHRIREAERLLGASLFYRKNKKLVPTSAGERLLHSAQLVLGEIEQAELDIAKYSAGIEQTVRLGLDHHAGCHWFPDLHQAFSKRYPSAEVEIIGDLQPDPLYCLRNGKIDLCLVSGAGPQAAFECHKLFADELLAVMANNHPLASQSVLEPEAFQEQTYVTYTTTPERNREYEQIFSPNRVFPAKVIRVGRTDAIIACLRAGMGISILPAWTLADPMLQTGLVSKRIGDSGIFIDWHVFLRREEEADSPARGLLECLLNSPQL